MKLKPTERALFALDAPVKTEGDFVIRNGKYFECGRPFVDMNGVTFSISTTEADAILPCAPVWSGPESLLGQLNINHDASLFTTKIPGKLGGVRRYWREGNDIMAEYALHNTIHEFFEGLPLEMSSEWDIPTKTPLGAAMVPQPAVKDAIMMAAFKASEIDPDLQQHHDRSCRNGAECQGRALFADPAMVAMMTPETLAAHQQVHDVMRDATGGKCCDVYKTRGSMYYSAPAEPSGAAGKGLAMFDTINAFFARLGASKEEREKMTQEMAALKEAKESTPPAAPATVSFAESPEYKALMAQQTVLMQQNADLHAQYAERDRQANFAAADAELNALVAQFRVDPSEAEGDKAKNIPGYRELIRSNYAAFRAVLPTLQARQPRFFSDKNPAKFRVVSEAEPGKQLSQLAAQMQLATKKPLHICMAEVVLAHPDLALAHKMAAPGSTPGEGNN